MQARIRAAHEAKQLVTSARDVLKEAAEPRMGLVPVAPVSGKAGEILQHLYPGEPVFIFRAKDILSVFALEAYAALIEKYDGQGDQALSLSGAIHGFRTWQKTNPDKVKLPD
mgnify:CR=1 FL=1